MSKLLAIIALMLTGLFFETTSADAQVQWQNPNQPAIVAPQYRVKPNTVISCPPHMVELNGKCLPQVLIPPYPCTPPLVWSSAKGKCVSPP
ncbi:MAG: hypothetical protein ACE5FM_10190 [Methyloligellaceae bacterium]